MLARATSQTQASPASAPIHSTALDSLTAIARSTRARIARSTSSAEPLASIGSRPSRAYSASTRSRKSARSKRSVAARPCARARRHGHAQPEHERRAPGTIRRVESARSTRAIERPAPPGTRASSPCSDRRHDLAARERGLNHDLPRARGDPRERAQHLLRRRLELAARPGAVAPAERAVRRLEVSTPRGRRSRRARRRADSPARSCPSRRCPRAPGTCRAGLAIDGGRGCRTGTAYASPRSSVRLDPRSPPGRARASPLRVP